MCETTNIIKIPNERDIVLSRIKNQLQQDPSTPESNVRKVLRTNLRRHNMDIRRSGKLTKPERCFGTQ